ncbi:expressed unknown protein [Seminavis robusta]|uniref:Uncharacterized protein n=1 Tax=Seminavis robusta TaxID=568900 RepID=A0A9N8DIC5_9STRA|nr:expressed unknown protein [Seminavis robusta]|eukprot:Sro99_g051020.1 n/a (306) ;mRNA; r:95326-96243
MNVCCGYVAEIKCKFSPSASEMDPEILPPLFMHACQPLFFPLSSDTGTAEAHNRSSFSPAHNLNDTTIKKLPSLLSAFNNMPNNMNKALTRAAKANEEGACLLELEDTSKALRYFRSALKQLNEGCQNAGTLPSGSRLSSSELSLMSLLGNAVSSKPIRLGEDVQAAALPASPENPTVLYSQAFVFEDPTKACGRLTIERHSFCSAVLIYNTALALHQKGSKEDGHKAYLKALLFYGESMNLLRPVAEEPESFRVIQEIMKNQADIYYKLNDLGNVQRVWEELANLTKDRNLVGFCQKTHTAVSA